VEIILQRMANFCWRKNATSGSSFFFLQKKPAVENIETEAGFSFKKYYIFAKI